MSDRERLEQLFSEQPCMVLAVALADGTPWVTPVQIQRIERGIFEWDSKLDAEHSKALSQNQAMAITVFQKHATEQIGFYAKGKGELIEEFKPGFGRYRFTASESWVNDETFVKRSVEL